MTRDNILCLGLFVNEGHFVQFSKDGDDISVIELMNNPTGDIEMVRDMEPMEALKFQCRLISLGYEQAPYHVLVLSGEALMGERVH